jgi:hypothetical protein
MTPTQSLYAYDMEALVRYATQNVKPGQGPPPPHKLRGAKDVQFFSVGKQGDRNVVIYMQKRDVRHQMSLPIERVLITLQKDSIFRVLEPVEHTSTSKRMLAPRWFSSRFGLKTERSDWFRTCCEFSVPYEAYDSILSRGLGIAILRKGGFDIVNLTDGKTLVKIPQFNDQRFEELAMRCNVRRPLGIFRSNANEFLLCYNGACHLAVSATYALINWQGLDCTLTSTVLHCRIPPWSSGETRRSVRRTTRRTCSSSARALSRSGSSRTDSSYSSSKVR